MTLQEVVTRFPDGKWHGKRYQARCPAHDDKQASLSIAPGDKGIVLRCHAGCDTAGIVASVGLKLSDLFDEEQKAATSRAPARTTKRIVAQYDYINVNGVVLYQAVRYEPKGFMQRRPDGANSWVYNLNGIDRILYRLPEVIHAVAEGSTIFVCEGEKDVDRLREWGMIATTNAGGAGNGKWLPGYTDTLTGASCLVLMPDNDTPGESHMADVARAMTGKVGAVKIMRFSDLPLKSDVSDWIKAGGTKEQFLTLVESAPQWTEKDHSAYFAYLLLEEGDKAGDKGSNLRSASIGGARFNNNKIIETPLYKATNTQNTQNTELQTEPPEIWDDPVPFGTENLPAFPVQALPDKLRFFANAVAHEVGTSVDLPAVQVLSAIAAATQKRVAVVGKPGYTEPLTLWCVSVAPPGSRKSAIMAKVRNPFAVYEAKTNTARKYLVDESISKEKIARRRLDKAEAGASSANPSSATLLELDMARRELDDLKPVFPLRVLADDATPEAIAVLLSQNEGRLAVLDSEGVVFGHMTGRYTDKPAIEIFLKSHSGETFTQDRAGKDRKTVQVRYAALTLGVTIQPEVLASLRKKRDLVGVGALARCLFSFAQDNGEGDDFDTPAVDQSAEADYRALINSLLDLSPSLDKEEGSDGESIPHMLKFTEGTIRDIFSPFYKEIRQQIRDQGEGPFSEWLAKSHGAALRIAGVLHMAKEGPRGAEKLIESVTLVNAIAITEYFKAHAAAAFAKVREDEATEGAKRILGWVRRNMVRVQKAIKEDGGVSIRDLRTDLRTFETQEEVESALQQLAARGFAVGIAPGDAVKPGRKPSPKWVFHPRLLEPTTKQEEITV